MNINELEEDDLLQRLQDKPDTEVVLFVTPFCGTCKLTEKMLEIVLEAGVTVPIGKVAINYAPVLRDRWKISSVPCLVFLKNGEPIQIEYAMRSVDHLYTLLNAFKQDIC